MRALIICSVHALCDISRLEREACMQACQTHGIPALLTAGDHARMVSTSTMLDVLNHLPGTAAQRRALVGTYLDLLNEAVWNAALPAYRSVADELTAPQGYRRPTAFVSDYPLLTTNLVRSAALMTNATRLGRLSVPAGEGALKGTATVLAETAAALSVAAEETDVLVAHRRDALAAQSLGMRPRIVEELQSQMAPLDRPQEDRAGTPVRDRAGPMSVAAIQCEEAVRLAS